MMGLNGNDVEREHSFLLSMFNINFHNGKPGTITCMPVNFVLLAVDDVEPTHRTR